MPPPPLETISTINFCAQACRHTGKVCTSHCLCELTTQILLAPACSKWFILTRSRFSKCLSGCRCLCRCFRKFLCWFRVAAHTSWVGCPLTITPTHCCHLSLWDKPWVTLEHHYWTFCCVGVRLQQGSIDWMGWGSTISCRIELITKIAIMQESNTLLRWTWTGLYSQQLPGI